MGRKGGKYKKKESNNPSKGALHQDSDDDLMNDEIDAFHKQRDIIPLDLNEDVEESDEDNEHPVFDLKDDDGDDDDVDDDDDEEDVEDDSIGDDSQHTGFAAKIARQQKYLRAKMGGVEDEMNDDAEDEEEKKTHLWGRGKNYYYDADNRDYELQSSDEELPAEEEAEVLRLQKEKAKSLTAEDFGLEDVSQDGSDREPTLEEILVQGESVSKASTNKETKGDSFSAYEEVKKDLNALTMEEQMDVVYSSAPELVGLLSELNDAFDQLENKVNPLIAMIRDGESEHRGMQYMEVKQLLLLSYCQAISFYLLLKSEGQPVRDHPVISRLVEIKNLLDKMKELDVNLPNELEDILKKSRSDQTLKKLVKENTAIKSGSCSEAHQFASGPINKTNIPEKKVPAACVSGEDDPLKGRKHNKSNLDHQNDKVGAESMEMLKVRAALEEKLKRKSVLSSITKKHDRITKGQPPVNGQLETLDDFDDDAFVVENHNHRMVNGEENLLRPSKLSRLIMSQENKSKFVSGDDDLPKQDDLGERRRKHELRVLAGAGVKSLDDVEDEAGIIASNGILDMDLDGESESDLEFYKQVEKEHAAKLSAKAGIYSRSAKLMPTPETLVDGKREISYQMVKNRGLTRARKKLTKNPRKKYKLKHEKAMKRRGGQVREIKKPSGPYGGEASGINSGISRSVRFKS